MTLPLIYLLNNTSASNKRWIINTVKHHNTDTARVNKLVKMVKEAGGLDYARERMLEYREKAIALIGSFPPSTFVESLKSLVTFTTERTS
jgi:octaprenyl-diphosphate synthase